MVPLNWFFIVHFYYVLVKSVRSFYCFYKESYYSIILPIINKCHAIIPSFSLQYDYNSYNDWYLQYPTVLQDTIRIEGTIVCVILYYSFIFIGSYRGVPPSTYYLLWYKTTSPEFCKSYAFLYIFLCTFGEGLLSSRRIPHRRYLKPTVWLASSDFRLKSVILK